MKVGKTVKPKNSHHKEKRFFCLFLWCCICVRWWHSLNLMWQIFHDVCKSDHYTWNVNSAVCLFHLNKTRGKQNQKAMSLNKASFISLKIKINLKNKTMNVTRCFLKTLPTAILFKYKNHLFPSLGLLLMTFLLCSSLKPRPHLSWEMQ